MRSLSNVALVATLALVLGGCASAPKAREPEQPNADLLADCPVPLVAARTNGELADTLGKYRAALRSCNDDKAALRSYYGLPDDGPGPGWQGAPGSGGQPGPAGH